MSRYLGERIKFTLRLDPTLARRLEIFANAENCSVNELIVAWLNKSTDDRYKAYIKLVSDLNKPDKPQEPANVPQ